MYGIFFIFIIYNKNILLIQKPGIYNFWVIAIYIVVAVISIAGKGEYTLAIRPKLTFRTRQTTINVKSTSNERRKNNVLVGS